MSSEIYYVRYCDWKIDCLDNALLLFILKRNGVHGWMDDDDNFDKFLTNRVSKGRDNSASKIAKKETLEEVVFVESAFKIRCHIVKKTLLHIAFSAILPAGNSPLFIFEIGKI